MSGPPEKVSYTTHHYRRWWQFWKPRHWTETNLYSVIRGIDISGIDVRGSDANQKVTVDDRPFEEGPWSHIGDDAQ